jgi:hypothetical protein
LNSDYSLGGRNDAKFGYRLNPAAHASGAAEKVTLACGNGPDYIVFYLTISSDAKTVEVSTDHGSSGTYPARITDDAVAWVMQDYRKQNYPVTYNRNSVILSGVPGFNGAVAPCKLAPKIY